MWHFIASMTSVPTEQQMRLAVVDNDGVHARVFPCYRIEDCRIHTESKAKVEVHPTHWREWSKQ
jgi:hypothetical protein